MKALTIVTSFMLVGLFLFAMINFGAQIVLDNNANNSIIDDPRINLTYSKLQGNLSDVSSDAETQKANFEKETPTLADSLLFTSIVGVGKAFTSTTSNMYNIIFLVVFDVLGFDPIILSVLGSILTIVIIFSMWRLYKAGE